MLNLLVTLVVILIVLGLMYWAVHRLAAAFGLAPPIVTVIDVLLVVIAVILLVRLLLGANVLTVR